MNDDTRRDIRRNLSSDTRRKFLEEAHEQAVFRAMTEATDEMFRRRNEQPRSESDPLEVRLERIEKRLELLEINH